MPQSEFSQGSLICSAGDLLQDLLFVAKGCAEASFNGRLFRFEKGDMIGVFDLCTGVHSLTYIAVTDTTLITTPHVDCESFDAIMRGNADLADLLVDAVLRKTSECLQYKALLASEAVHAYELIKEIYPQYEQLSKLYAFASKHLPGASAVMQFSETDPLEDWLHDYYTELNDSELSARKGLFHGKPGISLGFFHRGLADLNQALQACKAYQEYLKNISQLFINDDEQDLFALVSDLHLNSMSIKDADATLEAIMARLTGFLPEMTGIDATRYKKRMSLYREQLAEKRSAKDIAVTDVSDAAGVKQNLVGSLDVILGYSGCEEEACNKFSRGVQRFTELSDRGSSEDAVSSLRRELTKGFYDIYNRVLLKSLDDPAPPTIINMFLNFGYVDAALAGHENADFLFSIADSFKGDPDAGIYTLREWMAAIYAGQKDPSRSELDVEYVNYVRQLKLDGKIDASEEKRLADDGEGKLRFEMSNAFPVVNRITSGAVSLFCPLFSDQNMQRKPDSSLVRPELLKAAIDEIRSVDFSAFYRETAYINRQLGISDNVLHVEVLPELILLPNIGTRGMMWQEITGKKRVTPSRMFIPMFLQTDLKALAVQLTGEFRWEMCKRTQGARWSDISDPSLTSEYSDYLQFYKKSRDLSAEIKEVVKNELVRARNNYKTVFVSNYADWLQYEANGMQRLNKAVCRMLFMYCPFPSETREKLIQTIPRYADISKRFNAKQHQRTKYLTNLIQRISFSGKTVPQELHDELEYAKR